MVKQLSYLSDLLCINTVVWDVQRNDEYSGSGDGRIWQAQLAPPLWTADISINVNYFEESKKIAARVRALQGSKEAFLLNDPLSMYPASDPNGTILGSSVVTISAVNPQRNIISLAGLPANYKLSFGDKFNVFYGDDKNAFIEIAGDYTASSAGNIVSVSIFPELPINVPSNSEAIFAKPSCTMIIAPNGFNSGTAAGLFTTGLSFKGIQKK